MNQNYQADSYSNYQNPGNLNNNYVLSKTYSWPVIILLLIAFFPVGFYFMYKRFTVIKTATDRNYKGLLTAGIICLFFALFYFLIGISGEIKYSDGSPSYSMAIVMPIVFGAPAFIFLYQANKIRKEGKKYKKYIFVILRQKQFIIDNIAANVGATHETAIEELQKMLSYGFFPGAYINYTTNEFVLPEFQEPKIKPISNVQPKVVRCKSCGANNTVFVDGANECEYCGSPILN